MEGIAGRGTSSVEAGERGVVRSCGTGLGAETDSASGTSVTTSARSATIRPIRPSTARSAAWMPNRVASTRSRAVGTPPRWMWPRTVTRASKPVSSSSRAATTARDAAEPLEPERVESARRRSRPGGGATPSATTTTEYRWPRSAPAAHHGRDLLEVVGLLGHEDRVRAGRHPGMGRDPALRPAHDLDDHHSVVRLGRRRDAVDRLGRDLHGGVEPDRRVGPRDVVVDRLRDTDDGDTLLDEARAPCAACRRRRSRRARRAPRARPSRRPTRRPGRGRMGRAATCRGSSRRAAAGRARASRSRVRTRPSIARPSRRGSPRPGHRASRAPARRARIAAFRPGQSPPPVRIPIRPTGPS